MRCTNSARMITMVCLVLLCSTCCIAAGDSPESTENTETIHNDLALGITAIAASLAIGLCALATAIAQSRIGAAGCGTLAEKPELSGTVILLIAIPETMVILGFVVAVVLLFTI